MCVCVCVCTAAGNYYSGVDYISYSDSHIKGYRGVCYIYGQHNNIIVHVCRKGQLCHKCRSLVLRCVYNAVLLRTISSNIRLGHCRLQNKKLHIHTRVDHAHKNEMFTSVPVHQYYCHPTCVGQGMYSKHHQGNTTQVTIK